MEIRRIYWVIALCLIGSGCSPQSAENKETAALADVVSAEEWQRKIDALNGQLVATQQALSDAQVETQRLQALLESQTERLNDQLASITALEQDVANERSQNGMHVARWAALKSQLQGMQQQWQEFNLKFPDLVPSSPIKDTPADQVPPPVSENASGETVKENSPTQPELKSGSLEPKSNEALTEEKKNPQ